MEGNAPLDIYYDGECGVCSKIKDRLQSSLGHTLVFYDIRRGDLPPGITLDEAIENVHSFDGETVHAGGDVAFALLARTRHWRWLAGAEHVPFVRLLVRRCYRLLADHRPFFDRFI